VGFIPNNPNKVNQDSFILSPNLNGCNFRHYFGVCDGHGQNGKEASHYIKVRLPQLLGKNIDESLTAQQQQAEAGNTGTKMSPSFDEYKQIFHSTFITCNQELDHQNFDVNLSGSTVCTVLFNGTKVYCGNAGDSRAIKVAFPSSSLSENGGAHHHGSLTR
jgi:cGMP-dependent protein kinase